MATIRCGNDCACFNMAYVTTWNVKIHIFKWL